MAAHVGLAAGAVHSGRYRVFRLCQNRGRQAGRCPARRRQGRHERNESSATGHGGRGPHRRHQSLSQRAGHGRSPQYRHREDACRRRTHRGDVPRGADGQERRSDRTDRPTSLPGPARAGRRHHGARRGAAEKRAGRPRALSHVIRAGLHRQTATRHAGLSGPPVRKLTQGGPGPDRQCQAATHLFAHYRAGQRAGRPAPGRRRQHRPCRRHQRHRRHHATAAHHGRVHTAGRQHLRGHEEIAWRREIVGRCVRSRRQGQARDRDVADGG